MTMFGSQWLANAGSTYEIDQSIRFNDNDSPYLERTPSAAGNQKTNTISCWVKRTNLGLGNSLAMFSAAGGSYGLTWYMDSSETDFSRERLTLSDGAANLWQANDYRLRDPGSWYHFVFAMDTTQGTQSNRMKVYINGALVTADTNALVQNTDYPFFDDVVNRIGSWSPSGGAAGRYMEGYMAEIHLIDGAQKAASDFGEYNSTTGQWVPIEYTGAYGDQGAYLKGQDSSALGDDTSGNGNDFSSSGLAAADQMSDSPTNNWCIMNSLDAVGPTLSDGNLAFTDSNGSAWRTARATMAIPSTGKWYWECIAASSGGAGDPNFGIVADTVNTQVSDWYQDALAYAYSTRQDSVVNNDWTGTSRGTYAGGNVLQIAYDSGTGKLHFGIQNSWINGGDPADGSSPDFTTSTTLTFLPYVAIYNSKTGTINFGQSAFAYTPPTGFEALNTANLPDPAIEYPPDYFTPYIYTGDDSGTSRVFTGVGFAPNLVWTKSRAIANDHTLFDTVRGTGKYLSSSYVGAGELTNPSSGYLTAFGSDGYTFSDGSSGTNPRTNYNANSTYVSWNWVEGATPGFDIVSYTGNATARTIAHNLGVVPEMMIVKNRADTDNWAVYHSGNTSAPATDYLVLNSSANTVDDATVWNDTAPTSSVFSVGTSSLTNGNTEAMIAYVFADVEGFSKFGSYVGNNSTNGPMVNVGFRPAFIMIKSTDVAVGSWIMFDTKRDTYNGIFHLIYAQLDDEEDTRHVYGDILSNGFKVRKPDGFAINDNTATYVYAAFAESPFKTANAR